MSLIEILDDLAVSLTRRLIQALGGLRARTQIIRIGGTVLLYMIIEHFKNHDPVPVYQRFQSRGRLAPEGLQYVSSWVDVNLERCFQLMETDHPQYLDQWFAGWSDLVDFEVYPVISSSEAAEKVALRQ